MSSTSAIPVVFDRIAARLLTANPTPQPQLTRVITDDLDLAPLPDIPFAFLRFTPNATNTMGLHTMSLDMRHDYSLDAYVVIGEAQTPAQELHNRAKYWPVPIVKSLQTDLQLAGTNPTIAVDHLGGQLFRIEWQIQYFVMADGNQLFTLKFTIPVTQKFEIT